MKRPSPVEERHLGLWDGDRRRGENEEREGGQLVRSDGGDLPKSLVAGSYEERVRYAGFPELPREGAGSLETGLEKSILVRG